MAVPIIRLESGRIPYAQNFLTVVGHKNNLSRQYINELFRVAVPVPLARPRARWQPQKINTVLGQSRYIAELFSLTTSARKIEGGRVKRSDYGRNCFRINSFAHKILLCSDTFILILRGNGHP